jgi:formate/nitrite transporter FocA (FNT family)
MSTPQHVLEEVANYPLAILWVAVCSSLAFILAGNAVGVVVVIVLLVALGGYVLHREIHRRREERR